MVKIPTAEDLGLGPSATPQSTLGPQSINVPDLSIGAQQLSGLGRAMSNMFQSAAEAQIFHQKIEDERILMENESKLADLRREALYGDNGLMSRQLGDAVGATDDAGLLIPQWRDLLQSEGLSEAGRDAMEQYLTREEDNLLDTVARHEMGERNAYRKAMLKEAADRAKDAAQYYYMDPEALAASEQAIYDAEEAQLDAGASKGDKLAARMMAAARVEEMYKGVVLRAVADGADKQARILTADLIEKGVFSEQTASEMMAVVANGERETVVQYHAQAIWETSGGDLEKAYAAADALTIDGDAKKDLKAELDRRGKREADVAKQQTERITNAATALALEGRLDTLSRKQTVFIDDATMARLRDINAGVPTTTDPEVYMELHALSDEELAEVKLSDYLGSLSSKDYTTMITRQQEARDGINSTNRAAVNGTVERFFATNGIDDADVMATITQMTEDWIAEQDVVPDALAIRSKMVELIAEQSRPRAFIGASTEQIFEYEQEVLTNEPTAAAFEDYNSVPQAVRNAAIVAAAQAGYKPKQTTLETLLAIIALQEANLVVSKANVKAILNSAGVE